MTLQLRQLATLFKVSKSRTLRSTLKDSYKTSITAKAPALNRQSREKMFLTLKSLVELSKKNLKPTCINNVLTLKEITDGVLKRKDSNSNIGSFRHINTCSAEAHLTDTIKARLALEDGEWRIAYAVKGAMLAGDIFKVLANVSGLADNERKIWQPVAP